MTVPFLKGYSELLIRTCHRRGAFAMGGMAAQIPIKGDEAANEAALDKVRADKLREVKAGHDGTWVAHPALVPVAQAIFDEYMPAPNQLGKLREDVRVSREQLLAAPGGTISRAGFDNNVEVCLRYTAPWLDGPGCVTERERGRVGERMSMPLRLLGVRFRRLLGLLCYQPA